MSSDATETVRQIWGRGDRAGAVMVVEAGDAAQAEAAVRTLPLVNAGLVTVDAVIPLTPYAGFAGS